jgi:ankyrin repeat protein
VRGRSRTIANLIIGHGANVNAFDYQGGSALCYALLANDHKRLSLLLLHGADVNAVSRDGMSTAASFVTSLRLTKAVELLFELGTNPNVLVRVVPDDVEGTSLHIAARFGHVDGICQHIEHGAEVNNRANNGWTPLHFAVRGADAVDFFYASAQIALRQRTMAGCPCISSRRCRKSSLCA